VQDGQVPGSAGTSPVPLGRGCLLALAALRVRRQCRKGTLCRWREDGRGTRSLMSSGRWVKDRLREKCPVRLEIWNIFWADRYVGMLIAAIAADAGTNYI
jgi:hypothetical protein